MWGFFIFEIKTVMKIIEDIIKQYKDQIQIHIDGYAYTLENNILPVIILNTEQIFKLNLQIALLQWRNNQNPKDLLIIALNDFYTRLQKIKTFDDYKEFINPYFIIVAKYFAFLIDTEFNFDLKQLNTQSEYNGLDYTLYKLVLKDFDFRGDIENFLNKISKRKKEQLAFETYCNYFEILEDFEKNKKVENSKITMAESYFTKRAKDSFFSNGQQIEGGYLENKEVVDFRLAVILKKSNLKENLYIAGNGKKYSTHLQNVFCFRLSTLHC